MPEPLIDISSSELEPLRTGAAFAPITDRAFLRITGADATRWLNGMVTNNIKDLGPGEGNYNFLLNAQGRIQGDCMIYREPGDAAPAFLLETDTSQVEAIQQHLDKFIIMDDVEMSRDLTKVWGLLLLGTDSSWLHHRFVDAPQRTAMLSANLDCKPAIILATPSDATELWFTTAAAGEDTLQTIEIEGSIELSPAALEAHRILTGNPRYGTDITAKDLPQETALNGGTSPALHFTKGCYLGQEIVERIHSRGQVHRTFTRFTLTGEPPTLPAPLTVLIEGQAKPAGDLTSAARIDGTIHALGYIRREHAAATLTYPGGTAIVTPR